MATAQEYREAPLHLYDQALVELALGDTRQAGEKLWGAVAQSLKALAERRGWPHGQHREFFNIMNRVRTETDDDELGVTFVAARGLHVNFYENDLPAWEIRAVAPRVRDFVERVNNL